MMRARRPIPVLVPSVLALAAVLAAACGGKGGQEAPAANVSVGVGVGVLVSFDREVDPLPFDPRAERLKAAFARLAEIAGHGVVFHFDVALLPQYRSSFEEALIEAAEHAARDLRVLGERQRVVFERGARLVERIECRYDAAASDETATFDATRKTVTVLLPPRATGLLPEGLLYRALDQEHDVYMEARYGSAAPAALPPGEHAAYFRFLKGYRPHAPRRADLAKAEGYVLDPEADEIQSGIALYSVTRDIALRGELTSWLVDRAGYFTAAYVHHPGLVESAPREGSFHRTETAWVKWLVAALPTLSDEDRLDVTKALFVRSFNTNVQAYGRYARVAFPGLDPFAHGLSIVDEWRMAGYPLQTPDRPARAALYEHVVCPHPFDERGRRSRSPRCDHDWYEYALESQGGLARLAQVLLSRRDPYLTEAVVLNVGRRGGIDRVLELFRALERDEATWRGALRIIADEFAETGGDALIDESRRLYRAHPGRRGALVYLLAQVDRYGHGKVPWATLASSFGGAIGAADFAGFLDEGSRALSLSHVVWPGLAGGFSRARPIVARLERFMDDPLVRHYNFQDPWLALRGVVNRLCAEKAKSDLAVLHAAFSVRARSRPSESRPWENLLADTAPGACR